MKNIKEEIAKTAAVLVGFFKRSRVSSMQSSVSIEDDHEVTSNLVMMANTSKVKEMIDSGVCINWRDPCFNGYSYLHVAALKRNTGMVELLLGYPDIDPNVVDFEGRTALQYANREIACLLLRHTKIIFMDKEVERFEQSYFSRWACGYENERSLPKKVGDLLCFIGTINLVCKNFNKEMYVCCIHMPAEVLLNIAAQAAGTNVSLSEFVMGAYLNGTKDGLRLGRIKGLILAEILEKQDEGLCRTDIDMSNRFVF